MSVACINSRLLYHTLIFTFNIKQLFKYTRAVNRVGLEEHKNCRSLIVSGKKHLNFYLIKTDCNIIIIW